MNSSAITEDNFLQQIMNYNQQQGKNKKNTLGVKVPENDTLGLKVRGNDILGIKVLGDDTWGSLFPELFDTQYLFDSFNTKDINTVDNGIQKHLFKEYKRSYHSNIQCTTPIFNESKCESSDQIELFITHFLGVDHIGANIYIYVCINI